MSVMWRPVMAEDLACGAKVGRRKFVLRLGAWYRLLCRCGLHIMHEHFVADRWICACGRQFLNNEDLG